MPTQPPPRPTPIHPKPGPATPGPKPGPKAALLAPARYLAAFVWGVVALGETAVDRITGRHA